MVSIFPNPCLWRRSLRSNLGGIDLEKLYRATLSMGRALLSPGITGMEIHAIAQITDLFNF